MYHIYGAICCIIKENHIIILCTSWLVLIERVYVTIIQKFLVRFLNGAGNFQKGFYVGATCLLVKWNYSSRPWNLACWQDFDQ